MEIHGIHDKGVARSRRIGYINQAMQYYRTSIGFGRPWTPMVKKLILANVAVFALQILTQLMGQYHLFATIFALNTRLVLPRLMIWQLFTYMFLHGGVWHLFFNMFVLWMFGSEMEEYFGKKEFLFYYFMTGIAAGCSIVLVDLGTMNWSTTIGASGAIFGILLAYGMIYARRQITLLVFFVLPVTLQARTLVIILAVMELFFLGSQARTGVAHWAHLGGMLAGYLYFKFFRRSLRPYFYGKSFLGDLGRRFQGGGEEDEQRRLNEILDKINHYGIHTLTERERKFLEEMSRKKGH